MEKISIYNNLIYKIDLFLKSLKKIKYLKMMRLNFFKMIVKNKLICKIMVKIKKSNHIF